MSFAGLSAGRFRIGDISSGFKPFCSTPAAAPNVAVVVAVSLKSAVSSATPMDEENVKKGFASHLRVDGNVTQLHNFTIKIFAARQPGSTTLVRQLAPTYVWNVSFVVSSKLYTI